MLRVTSVLHRFVAGSSTAFGDLAAQLDPLLGRFAARTLAGGSVHGADDLANLVLFRLWHGLRAGTGLSERLTGTQALLAVLPVLTRRCAGTLWRNEHRAKRDASRTVQWGDGAGADVPAPGTLPAPLELPPGLTVRQRQIASLLAEGWLPGELHELLGCSQSTVQREIRHLRAAIEARVS